MVRPALLVLVAGLAAGPAYGQALDWSRAGGSLFFPPPATNTSESLPWSDLGPTPRAPQPFDGLVRRAAEAEGLDPKLMHALVTVESAYRVDALSTTRTGQHAGGLTQLMPETARDLGVGDRFDPAQNLAGGARYLAVQLRRFGDLRLALAAYNAGPERVARLGRIPRIPETQAYVARVVDCYLALAAGRSIRSAADCRSSGAIP